jgi:tetratricopeptide (TPR) repeat protein
VLLTVSGGVNFYIGNNPEATGAWWIPEKIVPPGARMDQRGMFDAFARAAGSETYEARHSAYWFGRGLDYIAGAPGGWMRLTAKKAALFWNNYEIPVNFDFAFFRSRLGAARLGFVPFCAVGSLGLLGLWLAVRRRRALWLVLVTAGLFAGTIAFFVCARYRVAAVPYLILFASYGLAWIIDTIRNREWKRLAGPAGIVAGGLLLAFLSFPFQDLRHHTADQYRNIWYHFFREGDLPRAEKWIREAVALKPAEPGLQGDLGMTLHRAGRFAEAAECLGKALEGMPGHPVLEKALDDALEKAPKGNLER